MPESHAQFLMESQLDAGLSDRQLIERWTTWVFSHNAEAAFSGLLGSACAIGYHRPHLFLGLLRRVLEPAVCMGVETSEQVMEYGRWLLDQDRLRGWRDFGPESHEYFTTTMPQYHAAIQTILTELRDEALLEP